LVAEIAKEKVTQKPVFLMCTPPSPPNWEGHKGAEIRIKQGGQGITARGAFIENKAKRSKIRVTQERPALEKGK